MRKCRHGLVGFSLVEVVLAIGVVSFAVLATFGLLSVASSTNKNAKDENLAARLAANEFNRIRSLSVATFPTTPANPYVPRYYDSGLTDLGQVTNYGTPPPTAVYTISISFAVPSPSPYASPSPQPLNWLVNADVAFPALAPTPNQSVFHFTTLMNQPVATPTPTPSVTPLPTP